jgi:LPS-assembly protein
VQYNPKTAARSARRSAGATARATTGRQRRLPAAARPSEQLDIGWQWPINDLWGDRGETSAPAGRARPLVQRGRLNFSLQDRKLVDSVIGLEYDAGCWLGRVVVERLQSSTSSANKRILFQLEFVGFTRLGSNPLQTLKDNIPRYQYLREQVTVPSRFSNYE